MLSKVKAWMLEDHEDADALSEISKVEVERRIRAVERKKTELREQIESLRNRYRSTVEKAERAHEHQLEGVRMDLEVVLKQSALARTKFLKNLRAEHFLRQIALAKRTDTSFEGPHIDRGTFPTIIRDPVEDVEICVDDVVAAARSDEPVPTLFELFDTVDGDEFEVSVHDQGSDREDQSEAAEYTREPDTIGGASGEDEDEVTGPGPD
jgi:hypothetical protein